MRNTTDTLRRGFDSTLANWPLIAIRIAESILFIGIVIACVVAVIIPVAVSAGFSRFDVDNPEDVPNAIAGFLINHWILIVYGLAIFTLLLVLLIAIHSFVEAGNAQVLVDAEHAPKFQAFNMERWMRGGRGGWWGVFWIYNFAWSVAGIILLIPLTLTIVMMLLVPATGPKIALGCFGLAITFLIGIPLAVITAIWTQKAIAVCVARGVAGRAALSQAWAAIRADFGRHFAVAFLLMAITFGGSMVISMFTAPMSIMSGAAGHGAAPLVSLMFAPMRIVSSLLQSVFSAAVGLWFLASFIGMTEERG